MDRHLPMIFCSLLAFIGTVGTTSRVLAQFPDPLADEEAFPTTFNGNARSGPVIEHDEGSAAPPFDSQSQVSQGSPFWETPAGGDHFADCECELCTGHQHFGHQHGGRRSFRNWNRRAHRHAPHPPRPLPGLSIHSIFNTQVSRGIATRMTLYNYDFYAESAELTPRGLRQLYKIAPYLTETHFPLIIQEGPLPELSESRRATILATLEAMAVDVPEERVIVTTPITRGMDGIDAFQSHQKMMEMQRNTSRSVPTIGGGSGARTSAP